MTSSSDDASPMDSYKKFISTFFNSNGGLQILIVSTVYAIGIGSVLGLIPQTLSDRYARINHGFTDRCHNYATKPPECRAGSDDAQTAAAWSHVALSALLLIVNPIISSLSDMYGRKPFLVLSLLLSCFPAAVFCLIIQMPNMSPIWYYGSFSLIGSVNYLSITFASIADVVPESLRGPSFGLILSGYFGGYSLAPSMTVILHNDMAVAWFSFLCTVAAFAASICFIPETLPIQQDELSGLLPLENDNPPESIGNIDDNDLQPANYTNAFNNFIWIWQTATRPLREISILSRSRTLLLVALGSFCSAMVFSIDSTLVIYYIEESLNVQKSDIALMTLALGITGILIQGCLVQPITSTLGDKGALVLAFSCGTLHNFLYGSASTKSNIYAALIISQLTKTNIPILSSVASKEVEPNEQGRVQGALFAINAVGNAVGPILVQFIYHRTKSSHGPGSMFIYASLLYAVGTVVVSFIPTPSTQLAERLEYEPLLSIEENSDSPGSRNDANSISI